MDLIGRWFWLICLAMTGFNYVRAAGLPAPAGVDGQRRATYLRRAALLGALPWIVMGAGVEFGGVRGVWSYFRPQDADPWVLAWFATLLALSIAYAAWVFLADGARKVREYDLLASARRSGMPLSTFWIKAIAAAGPFWILVWMVLASQSSAPLPH